MKTSDFDYKLPKNLIAHEPAAQRDQSRLMVLNRKLESLEHRRFYNITDYLNPGDLLVLNDTKVMPANLVGKKEEGGGKVEVLLVSNQQPVTSNQKRQVWLCLVKPGKRLKVGSKVIFDKGELVGTVLEKKADGVQIIEFEGELNKYMNNNGQVPLPPYIHSSLGIRHSALSERYQTVYADKEGASAAPTAGLHFTPELLEKIKAKGVEIAYLTLHTGLATFRPVWTENIEDHPMHSECFEISEETVEAVRRAKRVVAVGTTSVRALESIPELATKVQRHKGDTKLFIFPGYKFKVVDAMITNFHWPKSTLIMLVSAFAGRDFIMKAYQEAIEQKYRFYSFGDAMLIV